MSQIYNLNNLEDNKKCYGSIEKIKENTLKRIMEGEDNKHVHTLMTYCAVHHLDEALKHHNVWEGYSLQIEEKAKTLVELVRKYKPKNILEIGFNGGHSSLLFLINSSAKITSFDLGSNKYVDDGKNHIDKYYSSRHKLIKGNSLNTIPKFKLENNEKFDMIFIDGGHEYNTAIGDLKNCLELAHKNTIVILDDVVRKSGWEKHYTTGPTKAWDDLKRESKINELGQEDYEPGHGMSWGKYNFLDENQVILNKYKNKNKKQMIETIVQLYHQRNVKDLALLGDLYIDYFNDIEDKDLRLTYFFNGFAHQTLNNHQQAKNRYEYTLNMKDLEAEIKGWIYGNLGPMYGKNSASIPKIIHLLYFGETPFFNFQYKCVKSMIEHMPNYQIIIYNNKQPVNNKYWDALMKERNITIKNIVVPEFYDGFELKHFQYKADVVRLELLYEYGGVYLDLDMFIVKNFEKVINSGKDLYLSKEGKKEGLINAFIACKPKNEFLKIWLDNFKSGLRMNNWAYHIRDTNRLLLERNKHYLLKYNIQILEHENFMPFLWNERDKFVNIANHKFEDHNYGVHLYETILKDVLINNQFFEMLEEEKLQYYHNFKNDQFLNEYVFKNKQNGCFIELGATDGIENSQGYFFEKHKGWDGLAIEPCRYNKNDLQKNRKRPIFYAVGNQDNCSKTFIEYTCRELSGIKEKIDEKRKIDKINAYVAGSYEVEMITLLNLLYKQQMPKVIDFCGMDVEGSELDILKHYFNNNKKFLIQCFSVETNGDENYREIKSLLLKNGYYEIINPYLKEIRFQGREITWEKYFIHKSLYSSIEPSILHKESIIRELPSERVVLCLEEAPDKMNQVIEHLSDKQLTTTVFQNNVHENPVIGCIESHIKAIEYAKLNQLDCILVFEDDILILDKIEELNITSLPDQWDMLYFGGILTKMLQKNDKWVRGTIWCNHAYIVPNHMYDIILKKMATFDKKELGEKKQNIDWFYTTQIHPEYQCWLAIEQPIIQRESYSMIDKKVKWGNNFDWDTFTMKNI